MLCKGSALSVLPRGRQKKRRRTRRTKGGEKTNKKQQQQQHQPKCLKTGEYNNGDYNLLSFFFLFFFFFSFSFFLFLFWFGLFVSLSFPFSSLIQTKKQWLSVFGHQAFYKHVHVLIFTHNVTPFFFSLSLSSAFCFCFSFHALVFCDSLPPKPQ